MPLEPLEPLEPPPRSPPRPNQPFCTALCPFEQCRLNPFNANTRNLRRSPTGGCIFGYTLSSFLLFAARLPLVLIGSRSDPPTPPAAARIPPEPRGQQRFANRLANQNRRYCLERDGVQREERRESRFNSAFSPVAAQGGPV